MSYQIKIQTTTRRQPLWVHQCYVNRKGRVTAYSAGRDRRCATHFMSFDDVTKAMNALDDLGLIVDFVGVPL